MDVLVTYDIADTEGTGAGRLRRIADVCGKYGQRVQLSVFECRLSTARLARLIGEVEDLIDRKRDSVIVISFRWTHRRRHAAHRPKPESRTRSALGALTHLRTPGDSSLIAMFNSIAR